MLCSPNSVCKLEVSFSNISRDNKRKEKKRKEKKIQKSQVFMGFFSSKNQICQYVTHKMTNVQFSRARSHYDVIVGSGINFGTYFGTGGKRWYLSCPWSSLFWDISNLVYFNCLHILEMVLYSHYDLQNVPLNSYKQGWRF